MKFKNLLGILFFMISACTASVDEEVNDDKKPVIYDGQVLVPWPQIPDE